MQFKNPEVLYFLALLIIPILVHLFQLQKFVKTPFTNVAFLKQISRETRKSSKLKKWLVLSTRLLLFIAILFSFSQPYFSSKDIDKKQLTFIYLDNSLSTNAKGKKGDLLQVSIQEIINNSTDKGIYSLLTNNNFSKSITKNELKKELLTLKNTSKRLSLESVLLKISNNSKNRTNTLHKNILISDFQNTYRKKFTNVTQQLSLIKLKHTTENNISIDSVFTNNQTTNKLIVNVIIKNQGIAKNNTPIALYNNSTLISKQSFSIEENTTKTIQFIIENSSAFLGEIRITFNDTFNFDNSFYFAINSNKKINILTIGKEDDFLRKLYPNNEFIFNQNSIKKISYNLISKQQLVILNEVEDIPLTLQKSLVDYLKNGGNLTIIPNSQLNINSYNSFFQKINIGKINSKKEKPLKITNINYNHPLLLNVFSKKVTNFQFPTINNHYSTSFKNSSNIVLLENQEAFIKQVELKNSKLYWFAGSLNNKNSNFINSPLIVPVFYNFGKMSLQNSRLYYRLDKTNNIDVNIKLTKDKILSIKNNQEPFIPQQQTKLNKVTLTTKEQPNIAGFYKIFSQEKEISNLAYNNPKNESLLNFLDLDKLKKDNNNIKISSSIKDVFKEINKKNEVRWLWKWFLALAIVSLLLEIFILKFFKV